MKPSYNYVNTPLNAFRKCHFRIDEKHFDTFDQDQRKMFLFIVETALQNRFNLAVVLDSVYASFQICFVPSNCPLPPALGRFPSFPARSTLVTAYTVPVTVKL